MHRTARRRHAVFLLTSTILILLFISHQAKLNQSAGRSQTAYLPLPAPAFDWASRTETYPVSSYAPIPPPQKRRLPRIQHRFGWSTGHAQVERQQAVKAAFQRCWSAYRERAWLADELRPVSGKSKDHFAGWTATLVDALDTLCIMGLKAEFEEAVEAVMTIDFSVTKSGGAISLFETTIRYLGGLLSAYDLSGDPRLLAKAVELGHTLYGAFDTPNRMPQTYWDPQGVKDQKIIVEQTASYSAVTADIGSLTLEFTRLSQLTGDPKWYDAIARIMKVFASQQNLTNVPGMWPTSVNAHELDFHSGSQFTVGALSDSVYEYMLKMVPLLGGSDLYETMYTKAVDAIIEHILFRPLLPHEPDFLLAGKVSAPTPGQLALKPETEHLACFLGGLLALSSRLLNNQIHLALARQLTKGCIYLYDAFPLGIAAEDMSLVPCLSRTSASCPWNATLWHAAVLARQPRPFVQSIPPPFPPTAESIITAQKLPPGFTSITNRHYILRPEALESIFILYRITGDPQLRDDAWRMFTHIQNATRTELANAALADVLDEQAPKLDEMESFWLAETLKYLYLTFGDSGVVSLDEWVVSTEAHPLRRTIRRAGGWGWGGW